MNTTEPKPPAGPRLTLAQSRKILRLQVLSLFILVPLAAVMFREQHHGFAAGALLAALWQALVLPALWKQHQAVKNGAAIYFAANRPGLRMPQIISIIVVFVVTAFVSVCSAFIIYVVRSYFNTQIGWTVCGVTLLAIWLFVGYCWYRIATEKPPVVPFVAQEQPEGVWPPAPLLAVEEDNKH